MKLEELSEKIKTYRVEHKLTRLELAKKIQVDSKTLGKIENQEGMIRPTTIKKVEIGMEGLNE